MIMIRPTSASTSIKLGIMNWCLMLIGSIVFLVLRDYSIPDWVKAIALLLYIAIFALLFTSILGVVYAISEYRRRANCNSLMLKLALHVPFIVLHITISIFVIKRIYLAIMGI